MKKIILLPALLIATIGFSQTYKSSKILTTSGINNEKHTTTIKEGVIVFDDIVYTVSKTGETKGSYVSTTYTDKEDESRSFMLTYTKNKVSFITFNEIIDGTKNMIICYKPKVSK
jgi:hypothetical protein